MAEVSPSSQMSVSPHVWVGVQLCNALSFEYAATETVIHEFVGNDPGNLVLSYIVLLDCFACLKKSDKYALWRTLFLWKRDDAFVCYANDGLLFADVKQLLPLLWARGVR